MDGFLSIVSSWLPFVAAIVIPFVVGLLTKSSASSEVKAVTMLVITAISGLAYQVDQGGGILTRETASAWLVSLFVTVTSYYGVWKPLKVPNKLLPDKGVG